MNNWAKAGKIIVTIMYVLQFVAAGFAIIGGIFSGMAGEPGSIYVIIIGVLYGLVAYSLHELVSFVNNLEILD